MNWLGLGADAVSEGYLYPKLKKKRQKYTSLLFPKFNSLYLKFRSLNMTFTIERFAVLSLLYNELLFIMPSLVRPGNIVRYTHLKVTVTGCSLFIRHCHILFPLSRSPKWGWHHLEAAACGRVSCCTLEGPLDGRRQPAQGVDFAGKLLVCLFFLSFFLFQNYTTCILPILWPDSACLLKCTKPYVPCPSHQHLTNLPLLLLCCPVLKPFTGCPSFLVPSLPSTVL